MVFLAALLGLGLLILLQFNWATVALGGSSLLLVVIYPLMKRITLLAADLPGVGVQLGRTDGLERRAWPADWPALVLYGAGIAWTLVYDTIYAPQDRRTTPWSG